MTVSTKGYKGPLPTPDFRRQVAQESYPPFVDGISGEFVNSGEVRILGVAGFAGKVTNVIASVASSGKNSTSVPTVTFNVAINGTSVFTTKPIIAHVSGEAAQHKTTYEEAADTGITAAVIDEDNNIFAIGDILTWTATYSGAAAPTTKIRSPSILVEIGPAD